MILISGNGISIDLLSILIKAEKKDFWVVHAKKAMLHEALKKHQVLGERIYHPLSNDCLTFFTLNEGISRKIAQPFIQKQLSEIS
ncbi:MAG: hypothetical protein LW832_07255 [Parachlamydia sp.]|jgi:hypothetical protein|nr:hypothetical protein [Parachlamydia sp.]